MTARFPARITAARPETPTVRGLRLAVADPAFDFRAGQWVDLFVTLDGVERVGGYSLTSSPRQRGGFELAVKRSRRHPVTHYLVDRAQVGETVEVSAGQGSFVFERGMSDRLVLIGAGVGVTPLMGILRYAADFAAEIEATLIYSIPSAQEFLFEAALKEMAAANPRFRLVVTVTREREREGWDGLVGRIDAFFLREAGVDPGALYYVCGPQGMVEQVSGELRHLGVPEARTVIEKWW